jgi:hypothetical protein
MSDLSYGLASVFGMAIMLTVALVGAFFVVEGLRDLWHGLVAWWNARECKSAIRDVRSGKAGI